MDEFVWDISDSNIKFKVDSTKLGTFVSVVEGQDSLNFRGRQASIDLVNNLLHVGEVPYIKTADAFVYPDSGNTIIKTQGVIQTLDNAIIVADTINQYHKINRATVNILGRKRYRASGFYEYNIGDKEQEMLFFFSGWMRKTFLFRTLYLLD